MIYSYRFQELIPLLFYFVAPTRHVVSRPLTQRYNCEFISTFYTNPGKQIQELCREIICKEIFWRNHRISICSAVALKINGNTNLLGYEVQQVLIV